MNDPLFTPFEPSNETPAAAETPKRKRGRPSTKPPEAATNAALGKAAADAPGAEQPPKRTRKPRAVGSVRTPVSLSLPVSRVLAAVKDLHGDDTTLFEKLLGILAAAGKGQRERVIVALGKVFS